MIFEEHSELEGKHAVFAPSSPHWLRYDSDRLINAYINSCAAAIGTSLHELAARLIKIEQPLKKTDTSFVSFHLLEAGFDKKMIRRFIGPFFPMFRTYVNDAIDLHMQAEVKLYYSDLFFGTADAIQFYDKENLLRVHDLKSGITPAKMEQLETYAALYCLEYKIDPLKINFELRLYQGEEVLVHKPEPTEIRNIADTIVQQNKILTNFIEG